MSHRLKKRSLKICAALAALLLLSCVQVFAQSGSWTTETSMPTPRAGAATATLNGELYVVSGFNPSSLTTVEAYNPTTNTWSTKAPIPTARAFAGAAAINGKLYVVGGCMFSDCRIGTTNILEIYDSATNTWSAGAPMATARHLFAIGAIGGKIYVAGGRQACPPCNDAVTTEVYDLVTNAWTTKSSMPTIRNSMGSAVVNGLLYVVGGSNPALAGITPTVSSAVEAYDPATDTWAVKAPMLTPREYLGAAAVNGILYAISGQTANSPFISNVVEAYDPSSDAWTTRAPIPTARFLPQPGAINGVIYVAGNGQSDTAISTLEAFTPSCPAGLPGPQGLAGPQGDVGPQGAKGDAGAVGATGAQGPAGPQGEKGDTGAIGPQGSQGATGAAGAQGPKGDTGATGSQGPVGATGPIGPQGPAGPGLVKGSVLLLVKGSPAPEGYTKIGTMRLHLDQSGVGKDGDDSFDVYVKN